MMLTDATDPFVRLRGFSASSEQMFFCVVASRAQKRLFNPNPKLLCVPLSVGLNLILLDKVYLRFTFTIRK